MEVRLFGTFEVRLDGVPVTLTSSRAQSLLAYLALRPGLPQRRDQVAFLLWPDSTDQQARTNLRHVLHTLRASIPGADRFVYATAQTLTLRDSSSDATAFVEALDSGHLQAAADLYAGDLMEGWYDEWLITERDQYRRRMTAALDQLVPNLEANGEIHEALRYAERARALDRIAEAPYRALIRLHDTLGDRARAVRVYHECVATLEEQLGVQPAPETRALYETLLPDSDAPPRTSGTAVFVGRRAERQWLTELWREAVSGPIHLVVVTGEPGIGKSRLVEEFRHWVAQRGAVTATARSYAAEGALAYAPVVSWLREIGVGRWRGHLSPAHLAALAPLFPELAAPEPSSRLQLFDAVVHALHAGLGPMLLVADDLHAADALTLQFLHYLLRTGRPAPLLVAATARLAETDAEHPLHALLTGLRALGRCTELAPQRLVRAETATLARRLGHHLGPSDADRLHAETDGNPLFVVEALRAGWRGNDPQVLTPMVQAVLEARLLQLSGGARELIGLAATAGSSIAVDVLIRPGEAHRARDLDELWRRQLLLTSGGDTYDFSHDKLREVAYRMLSPAQRRRNHGLLALALRDVHAGRLDDVAGQIAAHLHEAGARGEAVDWYVRAATAARRRYADADAAELLHRAWQNVRAEGDLKRELELLTVLPGPLAAAEGYGSPRLHQVLDQAFEITDRLGVEPAAPLLRAQAMAVLSRDDFDAARQYGARLCALGTDDDVLAVEGHFVQGVAAAWRDEAASAREHLQAAVDHFRPANRPAHLLAYGQDTHLLCRIRLAHVLLRLGDSDEARRLQRHAIELAREVGHPFTLSAVLLFAGLLDLDLADVPALRSRVAELIELRERVEASPIRLFVDAMTGYLDVIDGAAPPGMARIDDALADPALRSAPGLPAMLLRIRLAAALAAGRTGEAQDSARRLLADGVRVWDPLAQAVLGTEERSGNA